MSGWSSFWNIPPKEVAQWVSNAFEREIRVEQVGNILIFSGISGLKLAAADPVGRDARQNEIFFYHPIAANWSKLDPINLSPTDFAGEYKTLNETGNDPGYNEYVESHEQMGMSGLHENDTFIAQNYLKAYWTNARLEKALDKIGVEKELQEVVGSSYLTIFSILLYIGHPNHIRTFCEKNVDDSWLPLDTYKTDYNYYPDEEENVIAQFAAQQWKFCPVVLTQGEPTFSLHHCEILPIVGKIKLGSQDLGSGGKIVASKVSLLSSGISWRESTLLAEANDTTENLLIEESTGWATQLLKREVERIKDVTDFDNIVRRLSFKQGLNFVTAQEYPTGGHLNSFFIREERPQSVREVIKFWDSLMALNKGLHHFHGLGRNTWDPASFGFIGPFTISVFKRDIKQFENLKLKLTGGSCTRYVGGAFVAPELWRDRNQPCLDGAPNESGIWSLGCVFSEALVWLGGGWPGLRDYRKQLKMMQKRKWEYLFAPFHDGNEILPCVLEAHEHACRSLPSFDDFSPIVKEIIEMHMLVPTEHRLLPMQLLDKFQERKEYYLSRDQALDRQFHIADNSVPASGRTVDHDDGSDDLKGLDEDGYETGSGSDVPASPESSLWTLPPPQLRGLIVNLATMLFDSIDPCKETNLGHVADVLPGLLHIFVDKIYSSKMFYHRFTNEDKHYLEILALIADHQSDIVECLRNMLPQNELPPSQKLEPELGNSAVHRFLEIPILTLPKKNIPLRDLDPFSWRNGGYFKRLESSHKNRIIEDSEMSDFVEFDLGPYIDDLESDPAYKWLVGMIQREAILMQTTRVAMDIVKSIILNRIIPFQGGHDANFELDWDPVKFIEEQKYDQTPGEALMTAITLTGSATDAQAMTTQEYLRQVWPSTGLQVVQLVADVVSHIDDRKATCILPDETRLEAWKDDKKFRVHACGDNRYSLAEVGEQLAWLGSALRLSQPGTSIAFCSPSVKAYYHNGLEVFFDVEFSTKHLDKAERKSAGQCWHSMFGDRVVVSGYPISAKNESGLGIEMPLLMMAALVRSDQATKFYDRVFIKGFSAMLIATKRSKDLVIWHYFYNDEGNQISYSDHDLKDECNVSLAEINSTRHVVGWCSNCQYYAGASDAKYEVEETSLPRPGFGFVLEKVTLSAGKFLQVGTTISLGAHDGSPKPIDKKWNIPSLRGLENQPVVLWDEEDKRGWLVNGTSVVLHLSRATLKYHRGSSLSKAFVFNFNKMENVEHHRPDSSMEVLINPKNMGLKLFVDNCSMSEIIEERSDGVEPVRIIQEKYDYYTFANLVREHCDRLERIIEYQKDAAGPNGIKIKKQVRKHLEGWDFQELAKQDSDVLPRVATLNAAGWGWVDFIRSIGAVTLFGRGFGEILQPAQPKRVCDGWKTLPKHESYLAASVFDLEKIMTKFGDPYSQPRQLVRGLAWHSPKDCECQKVTPTRESKKHIEPIHGFYPGILARTQKFLLRTGKLPCKEGAVIFGHSVNWGYDWKDHDLEVMNKPSQQDIVPEPKETVILINPQKNGGVFEAE